MKISYKPEIDGLRAIAVISVVIYHLEFQFNSFELLKGGFVGVDILTEKKEKIYFDNGHYSLEGAKHFGTKIKYLSLINFDKFF